MRKALFFIFIAVGAAVGLASALGPRIPCIDSAVESYLFDLRVPPEGFSCAARPVVF